MENKDKLHICSHCLEGLESRQGKIETNMICVDEDNEIESKCDFCEESGFDVLYEM